jgi:hypothetical protein
MFLNEFTRLLVLTILYFISSQVTNWRSSALKAFVANVDKRPHELSDQIFKERFSKIGERWFDLSHFNDSNVSCDCLPPRLSEERIIYSLTSMSIFILFLFALPSGEDKAKQTKN